MRLAPSASSFKVASISFGRSCRDSASERLTNEKEMHCGFDSEDSTSGVMDTSPTKDT